MSQGSAMPIAGKNLLQDRLRFVLSVAGIALAVMLILILSGFFSGVYHQATAYLDNTPGSVVVAQDGVSDFFATSSVLPDGVLQELTHTREVSRVIPIESQVIIFEMHGKKLGAQVIGYDAALGGGPWRLGEGREPQSDGEVVVDSALARSHDISVGSKITLLGHEFNVVGWSDGTSMWAASLIFIRKSGLESLLGVPGATSLMLLTPATGVTPEELRDRVERLGLVGTNVLLKSEMATNDTGLFARIYNAPIWLMVLIAFLVGALVVGLIIYTATVERQREYGMLKAIGAGNRLLYRVVILQALMAALAGSAAGVGLAYLVAQLIMNLRPQFLVAIEPSSIGWSLGAGLGMALLGALLPARTVARLAPAEVFRR